MRLLPPLLLAALLAVSLAACGGDPQPRYRPVATAAAAFSAESPEVIEVAVLDLPPGGRLSEIVLIAPDGREYPAVGLQERSSESGPGYGPTGVGFTLSGGSSSGLSTGVSIGVASGTGGSVEARRIVSARIPLPDPVAYAAAPRDWAIEARWIDVTGETRVIRPAMPLP